LNNKEVVLDFDRINRTGLAEAVFCGNKSQSQLSTICEQLQQEGRSMLFTKMDRHNYDFLEQSFPGFLDYDEVSKTAFQACPEPLYNEARICIITAGSSDVPVAREASRTLRFYGHPIVEINDVGVAGLWRLTDRLDDIRDKQVIICVAGMDAALPTVLGGLVPGLIIAVPSSVGYGMAKQGETALQALLCSCASGLVVVNIDNGYGAACAALRAINNLS
jgi:NCAIR mutase (PurE)-related protein